MGEKLVTAETRRLRMEEDPYQKAKKRFDLRRWAGTGTKATEAFCGRENVDRVYAIQDKLPTEIKRGADSVRWPSISPWRRILKSGSQI